MRANYGVRSKSLSATDGRLGKRSVAHQMKELYHRINGEGGSTMGGVTVIFVTAVRYVCIQVETPSMHHRAQRSAHQHRGSNHTVAWPTSPAKRIAAKRPNTSYKYGVQYTTAIQNEHCVWCDEPDAIAFAPCSSCCKISLPRQKTSDWESGSGQKILPGGPKNFCFRARQFCNFCDLTKARSTFLEAQIAATIVECRSTRRLSSKPS